MIIMMWKHLKSAQYLVLCICCYFSPCYFFLCCWVTINLFCLYNVFGSFKAKESKEVHGYLRDMLISACKSLSDRPLPLGDFISCCVFSHCSSVPQSPQSAHFLQPDFCSSFWPQVQVNSSRAQPSYEVRSPWLSSVSLQHFSSCK